MSARSEAWYWFAAGTVMGVVVGGYAWWRSGMWTLGLLMTIWCWLMFTWGDKFARAEICAHDNRARIVVSRADWERLQQLSAEPNEALRRLAERHRGE